MYTTEDILEFALQAAGMTECPADSGVLVPGKNIKKVVFGIDIEAGELLIAKHLGADAVITHHPMGGGPKINLHKVMENQIDRMVEGGVPINKAQKALKPRMEQVERGLHVSNFDRSVSAAKALNMPFLAIHSPADKLAEATIQGLIDEGTKDNPKAKVKDILAVLNEIPEVKNSIAKPVARVGRDEDFAGKVFVTMAGGTGGGAKVYEAYFEAGIGTLVMMHIQEDALSAVKKHNIGNVIVAGHMASDSVGINKVIDVFEGNGIEVIRLSGVLEPR